MVFIDGCVCKKKKKKKVKRISQEVGDRASGMISPETFASLAGGVCAWYTESVSGPRGRLLREVWYLVRLGCLALAKTRKP